MYVKPKKHPFRRAFALVFAVISTLALWSCSGPLAVPYNIKPDPDLIRIKEPAKVLIQTFKDSRAIEQAERRAIGKISTTVSDITGGTLVLTEAPASVLEKAFEKELAFLGYEVRRDEEGRGEADLVLTGELKAFRLDIGTRDEIEVLADIAIADGKTGEVLWSGAREARGDRFAGVMGNSRRSISEYITATLSKMVRKTLREAGPSLERRGPAPTRHPEGEESPSAVLRINTVPERARVYLGDVYYGLTPMTIEMEPGVYDLTLRLAGHKPVKEKVSVRKGQTTELESALEKE